MSSACAPCVFGASSSLFTYPLSIVSANVTVTYNTITTVIGNLTSTAYQPTTIFPTTVSGATTVGHDTAIVITALGTTLTYPTVYAQYLDFVGAAVTTPASITCAQSLTPTPLTTPAALDTGSLVFPTPATIGLPDGLLSYLDSVSGFTDQLNGDDLRTCSIIAASLTAPPIPPTETVSLTTLTSNIVSASTAVTTSVLTSASTIVTSSAVPGSSTVPVTETTALESTTIASTTRLVTSATTQTASLVVPHSTTATLVVTSATTLLPIVTDASGGTTTIATPVPQTLGGSSSTQNAASYTNSTVIISVGTVVPYTPTSTYPVSLYTGGASKSIESSAWRILQRSVGVISFLLLW